MRIRELRTHTDPAFRDAYRLLNRSFQAYEMAPWRRWTEVMKERRAGLWIDLAWHVIVAQRGRTVLGVVSGTYLGNANIGVVGYLVIVPPVRGSGIGHRLRDRLQRAFERDARRIRGSRLGAIVGEVRRDNPWLRGLVERDGVIALDFPYFQPPIGGRGVAPPYVLYYQPLRAPRTRWLAAGFVRQLIYTMWRRPYRVANPLSHRVFRQMLAALRGRRRIGQRADFRAVPRWARGEGKHRKR